MNNIYQKLYNWPITYSLGVLDMHDACKRKSLLLKLECFHKAFRSHPKGTNAQLISNNHTKIKIYFKGTE